MHSKHTIKLFCRDNPSAPFDIYSVYAAQNPQYKNLIDSFFLDSGINPELASIYPEASREVALMQLHPLPSSILCLSSTHSPLISESAMWWMQTYGPDGNRLVSYEKCISIVKTIISRFGNKVPPFQQNYKRLIPTLLSQSIFQSLSNALVDAYSIFMELNEDNNASRSSMDVDTTTTTYQQTTTPTNPIIPREVITNKEQDFTCHSDLSELPHDLVPNQSQNDLSGQQVDNNESPISTTPAENHEILPYPSSHAVEEHGNTIVASFNKMATRSQSRALLSKNKIQVNNHPPPRKEKKKNQR
jgi:hypothetical protein